jgi:hypothetical protein
VLSLLRISGVCERVIVEGEGSVHCSTCRNGLPPVPHLYNRGFPVVRRLLLLS